MKIVKENKSIYGKYKFIACTDCYETIYINESLAEDYYNLALRHEQYHCNAMHGLRSKRFKPLNKNQWNIALDLELARAIYSDEDEALINAIRSPLKGGITRDFQDIDSSIVLAEDLYPLIKLDGEQGFDGHTQEGNPQDANQDVSNLDTLIKEAKQKDIETKEEQEQAKVSNKVAERTKQASLAMLSRNTLASTIDSIAQSASGRDRNFSRPSRRPIAGGIITRADVREDKKPEVFLFVDCSGSFTPEKTKHSEEKVKRLTSMYGWRLKLSTFYFGDDKIGTKRLHGGGNTPYYLVSDTIDKHQPKLAIVITDNDGHESYTPPKGTKIATISIGCDKTAALNNWGVSVRE